MSEVLAPRLTALDERVLAILRDQQRGVRASYVTSRANGRLDRWSSSRTSDEEVRAILRGFEHLGTAACRGGWWRAL